MCLNLYQHAGQKQHEEITWPKLLCNLYTQRSICKLSNFIPLGHFWVKINMLEALGINTHPLGCNTKLFQQEFITILLWTLDFSGYFASWKSHEHLGHAVTQRYVLCIACNECYHLLFSTVYKSRFFFLFFILYFTAGEGRRERRGGKREKKGGKRKREKKERREDGNKIITSNFMHFLCHAGNAKVGTLFKIIDIFFAFQLPPSCTVIPNIQWLLPFRVI